jgi:hypothetical protein
MNHELDDILELYGGAIDEQQARISSFVGRRIPVLGRLRRRSPHNPSTIAQDELDGYAC